MRSIIKTVSTLLLIVLITSLSFLTGCEGGGGDSFNYGDNDPNVWVAFGDSITSGLDGEPAPYPSRLAAMSGANVINEGYSGEKVSEARGRVYGILNQYKPGRLMVLYGVNDIMAHADYEDIVGNLRYIVQAAKANNTRVKLATMTPMIDRHNGIFQGSIEEVNVLIKAMAAEEGVELVDLAAIFGTGEGLQTDGLHPNAAGSDLIAAAFR